MKVNSNNNSKSNNNGVTGAQNIHTGKHQRPENKDDLDSRKNEEYDFKGGDITHNKKETKKEHLHNHNTGK